MRDSASGRPHIDSLDSTICATCGRVQHTGGRRRAMRPRIMGLGCALVIIVVLAALASGLADYWRSLAQNTAADLTGAVFFMYVLGPITGRRGQDGCAGPERAARRAHIPTPRAESPHQQAESSGRARPAGPDAGHHGEGPAGRTVGPAARRPHGAP